MRTGSNPLKTSLAWEFFRVLFVAYFRVFHCVKYVGVKNIPTTGPIIIAPNHVSYYDPPLIGSGVPHFVRTMAWDLLFKIPIFAWGIRYFGAYPVKLKTADKGAVGQTLGILHNGGCIIVFPEGERSQTGALLPYEKGVARVALQTKAAIVPVTITGVYEAFSRHSRLPRWFRPMQVKFHPAVQAIPPAERDQIRMAVDDLNARISAPVRRRLAAWEKLKQRGRKTVDKDNEAVLIH